MRDSRGQKAQREDVVAESLAHTVVATIASGDSLNKVAVTTRYQLVVRFPDGARRVFAAWGAMCGNAQTSACFRITLPKLDSERWWYGQPSPR